MDRESREIEGRRGAAPLAATAWKSADRSGSGTRSVSADAAGSALARLAEEFAFGMALVDGGLGVHYANRAARARLAPSGTLCLVEGRLCGTDRRSDASLRQAIEAACAGRRGYRVFGKDSGASHIAFVPVAGAPFGSATGAALLFEGQGSGNALARYFFSRHHGLTPSEERVLAAIGSGTSVAEASIELNTSENTVRTHVRRILDKTGCENLRALVARMGRLPPLAAQGVACERGITRPEASSESEAARGPRAMPTIKPRAAHSPAMPPCRPGGTGRDEVLCI
ncbi:MAG: response regulator transcription factor [Burkholderiales bacterium]|nr:response regulator transcription factor [Burkholderiales bacterium]